MAGRIEVIMAKKNERMSVSVMMDPERALSPCEPGKCCGPWCAACEKCQLKSMQQDGLIIRCLLGCHHCIPPSTLELHQLVTEVSNGTGQDRA
jgi:hypothetical protein